MSKYIIIIICILGCVSCKNGSSSDKSEPEKLTVSEAALEPGFFHNVYFFLNPAATSEQIQLFENGLDKMKNIPELINYHVGRPAMTPREVVDNTYQYSIITSFADKAGHDAYQVHPIHDDFRNAIAGIVDSVRIYDSIIE